MSSPIKIGVICNNRMALPVIHQLLSAGLLAAIGVPENNEEVLAYLEDLAGKSGVLFKKFNKQALSSDLNAWITLGNVSSVFMMTFPWKIPSDVLGSSAVKIYNFHYGLLPEMKGADPIFETIRQQKTETGITIHLTDNKLDGGPILIQQKMPVDDQITHGMLCTSLSYLGAQLSMQVCMMLNNDLKPVPVKEKGHYYARAVLKDVTINWSNMDSKCVHALIRACNPWNKGAYTSFNGWNFRITSASLSEVKWNTNPGTVHINAEQKELYVTCADRKCIRLEIVSTEEGFYSGFDLEKFGVKNGDVLG